MRQDPCGGHGSAGWKGTESEPILFAVDLLCCKTRTFARAQSHMGSFCFPLSQMQTGPSMGPSPSEPRVIGRPQDHTQKREPREGQGLWACFAKRYLHYFNTTFQNFGHGHRATYFSCKCFNVSPTWLKMAPKWLPIPGAIFWNPNTKVPWMNGKNY